MNFIWMKMMTIDVENDTKFDIRKLWKTMDTKQKENKTVNEHSIKLNMNASMQLNEWKEQKWMKMVLL